MKLLQEVLPHKGFFLNMFFSLQPVQTSLCRQFEVAIRCGNTYIFKRIIHRFSQMYDSLVCLMREAIRKSFQTEQKLIYMWLSIEKLHPCFFLFEANNYDQTTTENDKHAILWPQVVPRNVKNFPNKRSLNKARENKQSWLLKIYMI